MAAIKDVAKLAGVSVAAVSKYLKTPNNMREDTRQRIAQAIEELNYRPNPFAQSLRTGKPTSLPLPSRSWITRISTRCSSSFRNSARSGATWPFC